MRQGQWRHCVLCALTVLLFSKAHAAAQGAAESSSFVPWREPNEGRFSLDVPRGWKVGGGILRRTPVDVRSAVNAVSPDGAIRVVIGDDDLVARREPDAAQRVVALWEGP